MKRNAIALAAGFMLSAALGAAMNGCQYGNCHCEKTPDRPEPQGPLSGLEVVSFDSRGEIAQLLVKPESGTLEVTADTVVIVYQQGGVEHRVVYGITGPL